MSTISIGKTSCAVVECAMSYLFLGFSLGLSAGLAPGPLLALVIQRTLRHGFGSGMRIALAPLLTDLPIVILSLLVIARLPELYLHGIMGLGGLFVLWLAFEALRETTDLSPTAEASPTAQQDYLRGMLVNFLNPHPYLFWATVGAPIVIRAWQQSPWHAALFILVFYLFLIGSKMILALVLARIRHLPAHIYHRLMQFSGLLLLIAALFMLYTAWQGISPLLGS